MRFAQIVWARPEPATRFPLATWSSAFSSTPRHGVFTKVDPICLRKSVPRAPEAGVTVHVGPADHLRANLSPHDRASAPFNATRMARRT